MTRDYSKKSSGQRKSTAHSNRRKPAKSKQPGSGSPFFAGLFVGLVLGVILTTLIDFPESETPEKLITKLETDKNQPPAKPRFDFYTLLRESEVIVSADETPILNEHLQPPEDDKPSTNNTLPAEIYLLQVGSFKKQSDADSLRVNLLLLNLQATIEKVSPRPSETWHRVLVGPMNSRSDASEAKSKLASNGIDSLLLKRKR